MKRITIALFLSFLTTNIHAYFIIAEEVGSIMYDSVNQSEKNTKEKVMEKLGVLKEGEPQFKIIYEVNEQKRQIKRLTVVNLKTKEVIPDETIYQIVSQTATTGIMSDAKAIHAVGAPGISAYELLTVCGDSVMSAKSTGNYMVISNMKVIERTSAFPSVSYK